MSCYKTCAVPMCKSTIKNSDKLFIHVPKCVKRRKQWVKLARRNPDLTSNNSTIYFCEDHFDLPNDMENYTQYKIMGSISQIRMMPNCLPSRFECQPDRLKRMASIKLPQLRSVAIKRQQRAIVESIFEGTKQQSSSGRTSMARVNNNDQMGPKKCNLNNVRSREAQRQRVKRAHQVPEQIKERKGAQKILTLKRKIKEDFDLHESQDDSILNISVHAKIKQEDLEDINASVPNLSSGSASVPNLPSYSCSQTDTACGSPTRESHIEYEPQSTMDVTAMKEEPGSTLCDVSIHPDAADSPEEQAIKIKLGQKIKMLNENAEILKKLREEICILEKKHIELLADIKYLQNMSKKKYKFFELNEL